MANYQPPQNDMLNYLVAEGVIPSGQGFVNSLPDFTDISSTAEYAVVVKVVDGMANPKWLRDQWVLTFQVVGKNKSKQQVIEGVIWNIFNKMIGSDNITVNNQVYLQFNSEAMPWFVGYLDNSQPIMSCQISLVVEGLANVGSRIPLC